MKETLASYRYARALNESVENDQELETVLQSLRGISDLIETSQPVRSTLLNPAIMRGDRQKVLQVLLEKSGAAPKAASLVVLLFKRHRLALLPFVTEQFSNMADERLKRISADVRTAQSLTENETTRIQKSLETYSNKTVTLNIQQEPELLGGIVARIGNTVIDGSLQTRLERLKEALLAEELT